MKKKSMHPVIILGAGPSGMTCALALARWQIPSVIIEKRTELSRHPKAHEISGRTIEIFRQLGINEHDLQQEASNALVASRISFGVTASETFGAIDLQDRNPYDAIRPLFSSSNPYLNISQSQVEQVLLKKIRSQKRLIDLRRGWEFVSLEQNHEKVMIQVQDSAGKTKHLTASYLLCCDGAESPARKVLGIQMQGPSKIQDFCNAYFHNNLGQYLRNHSKLYFVFKPDAMGTLIAHHPQKRWVYHFPVMTPYEQSSDYTAERIKQRIKSAIGIPGFEPNIESISTWRMTAQVADTFSRGRAFLVGDSAHRFPPTGGLGLNSGVADAHNLCFKLALVLKDKAAPQILYSYEEERRPVIEHNCEESRQNFVNLQSVPAILGLKIKHLQWLLKILSVFSFVISDQRKKAILAKSFQIAEKRLHSRINQLEISEKVKYEIEKQRSHFDRIGIDLGYEYASGFLAESNRVGSKSTTAKYVRTFHIGSRIPEMEIKRKSLHQQLAYDRFSVVWFGSFRSKPRIMGLHILDTGAQVIIGGQPLSAELLRREAGANGLLIRPDGHICAKLNDEEKIAAVLKKFIISKEEKQSGEVLPQAAIAARHENKMPIMAK